MNEAITVGLVEDQLLFREGMKAILNSWQGISVVFESAEGYTVLEQLSRGQAIPDVMLVDLSLPPDGEREFSGLHLTEALLDRYPELKILVLSVHDDDNFISQLIEHGAHGYLVKDSDPQEVHEAICAVHQRGSYVNERTLKALQKSRHRKAPTRGAQLDITKREIEILRLVCQQHTAEEIAEKLFISVRTVNGHRNNLLQKTGSRNVTGLVVYAIRNQIITVV